MKTVKLAKIAREMGKNPQDLLIELYAKHGNMTDVARELNVTASTVSTAILRYELLPKTILVCKYPSGKAGR